ncbi:OmpA family protein [Jannaschia sp. LMIT008]|uniref:OmpA family protein n=1 Tax=Jannaschia maritima TaxID=3032585 RepID=UPI002810A428|nr:OmpA family protein [Jannaschia sp. LMIT008]
MFRITTIVAAAAVFCLQPVTTTSVRAQDAAAGGSDMAATFDWQGPLAVYFESGSARIPAEEAAKLDTVVRTFRDGAFVRVEVAGVADTVGAPDLNLRLSTARAQSVVDGLIARGLDPLQLQLVARGNGDLVVDTGDEESERENRVAQIRWR